MRLRDDFGNLLDVQCRVPQGKPELPEGTPVVLLRFGAVGGQKVFVVKENPLAERELIE